MYEINKLYHKSKSSNTYKKLLASYTIDQKIFDTWEVRRKTDDTLYSVDTFGRNMDDTYSPYKKPVVHEKYLIWYRTGTMTDRLFNLVVDANPDENKDYWKNCKILKIEKVTYTEE